MKLLSKIIGGKQPAPRRVMLYGSHGVGKAQPLDSKILTPHGFVKMGSLAIGADVIGSDGKPHRVIGVYPQGEKEVFEVTFRDGSSSRCCDDHLWFTQTCNERMKGLSGAVRTLHDIRRSLRNGTHFNHGVPRVKPVEFATSGKDLPIDPWLLGMYLGDGSWSTSILITNPEKDVQERIASSVSKADACVSQGDLTIRIKERNYSGKGSETKRALKTLELDGLHAYDKFVPLPYLHASVEDRLSLLRGLLDSDGYVTKPGAIEICTVSSRLADGICFLIRSLGGSAKQVLKKTTYTHNGEKRKGMLAYRIFGSFTNGIVPVSSEKHTQKWAEPQWMIRHTIRTVESVGKMPCQCIRIDAPDSLYVTDDFILTHNSTFGAMTPKPIFIQTEDGLGGIDCDRFPLAESFEEVIQALSELYAEKHTYRTVVVDTLDWLERLIWADVCQKRMVESMEDVGYGKAYIFALTQWRAFLDGLSALRADRGMMVVLLAHAKIERFENPETESYDRYAPRLHKHASAMVQEWCDEVFFAGYKVFTKTTDEGFSRKKAKGIGTGERVIKTTERPSHLAKNRLSLPEEMPFAWAEYAKYLPK